MLQPGLFRERALLRQARPDPLDDLPRVTAPHEWIVLVGFAVAFVATCVWSAFGSLDRSVAAHCVIQWSGERHSVLSGATGTVVDIPVRTNGRVAEGEPIARLLLPELEARLAALQAQIAVLEREAARDGAPSGAAERLAAAQRKVAEQATRRAEGGVVARWSGTVAALHLHVGQAVAAAAPVADLRLGESSGLEVLTYLPAAQARELRPEMAARIAVDSFSEPVPAVVAAVSPEPSLPPAWYSRMAVAAVESQGRAPLHRVRLNLIRELDTPPADTTPCQVRIVVETVSPFRLLASTGP